MLHFGQQQRTGGTVEHGHAIQQETGRQRTQHKVLHGRLAGFGIVTTQRHHGIGRQCQQFQTQVDQQEMVGRGQHEDAQQAEQHQRVELATTQEHAALLGVRTGIDQRHESGQGGKTLQPAAHGVAHHRIAEGVDGIAVECVQGLDRHQRQQRQLRQQVGRHAARALHEQVGQQDHTGHHRQENFRIDGNPTQFVNHCRLSQGSLVAATCCSRCATEASMTSVKGLG